MSPTPSSPAAITLILGGARSGKSRHAQQLAEQSWCRPIFLASAECCDDEMRTRIARHQSDRGPAWQTLEEPRNVAEVFSAPHPEGDGILWDCATVWLGNLLHYEGADNPEAIEERMRKVCEALSASSLPLIVVSNEVGQGIVPSTPLGRRFRDLAGRFNQHLAQAAHRVLLITAGLPQVLKP